MNKKLLCLDMFKAISPGLHVNDVILLAERYRLLNEERSLTLLLMDSSNAPKGAVKEWEKRLNEVSKRLKELERMKTIYKLIN